MSTLSVGQHLASRLDYSNGNSLPALRIKLPVPASTVPSLNLLVAAIPPKRRVPDRHLTDQILTQEVSRKSTIV